jgi:hypothetical protein
MSAILFGCTRFHDYIYGQKVTIVTDHKPLVGIFAKPIHRLSPRLQRMRTKLLWYDLDITWVPDKELYVADALSRATVTNMPIEPEFDDVDVNLIISQLPASQQKLNEFRDATSNDPVLQKLLRVILSGWPAVKGDLPDEVKPYFTFRDDLVFCDGLLFKGNQLVVPKTMHSEMLSRIHESHQGIVKSKRRAREVMFWIGMSAEIEDKVGRCPTCAECRNANTSEPLIPHEMPDRPWAKIGADMCHYKGQEYLVLVDYYSKFPEVIWLSNLKAHTVITAMKSVFARFGSPEQLISDNGPPFSSAEFAKFVKFWEINHITSSPGFAQ